MWKSKSKRPWVRIAFLLFLAPISLQATFDVDDFLSKISVRERFYLEEFFRTAVYDEQFGYTLFFDKPVSATGFIVRCPKKELPDPHLNRLVKKGWRVWKKYEGSIPHSGFLLLGDEENFFDSDNNCTVKVCNIYLINKKEFLTQLERNRDLFRFSPETLLEQIERTNSLRMIVENDEALLGILFGFGREASLLFATHEKEKTSLDRLVAQDSSVEKVEPVIFMGDQNSLETQNILKKYDKQRKYLDKIFSKKDFLKLTLEALTETTHLHKKQD